jgi:hypothetical protein
MRVNKNVTTCSATALAGQNPHIMRVSEAREAAGSAMTSNRSIDRRVKSISDAHSAKYKKTLYDMIFGAVNESLF